MNTPSVTSHVSAADSYPPNRIQDMFNAIAQRYDLLNHVLSFCLDYSWRKKAVSLLDLKPRQRVLDLCCGTGDLALAYARKAPALEQIIGLDFSSNMVRLAEKKTRHFMNKYPNSIKFKWLEADAMAPPFPRHSFDHIGCAFGIRNLPDPQTACQTLYRLLKPGGQMLIIEFSLPKNRLFRSLYLNYLHKCLPNIASVIAEEPTRAYHYLSDSIQSFSKCFSMADMLKHAGFINCRLNSLCNGAVSIWIAAK